MEPSRQIDILDMPFEGLAAYWLSIKKLSDAKKIRPILEEELAHTGEPFVRFLLEAVFSGLDSPTVRRLAEARRDKLLRSHRRKLDMMRVTLIAVPARENPRVTLVRMNGLFPQPPMEEKRAIDMAGALADSVRKKEGDMKTLLEVDHKMSADRLLVKMLFYAMHARQHKRLGLERFLPYARTPFFAEGLALVVDGFDARFLERHLPRVRDEILDQAGRKMDMATEMALAVREKLSYEDVHLIARAWLP
ncbi:hypothetical protein [Paucidesulfovibrio longus]|uniref:hypothetical protein n=1 Tax=Paucidesulfovibrio longus TaxID=889 RepID=UPI0003B742A8|nr:hypothetical protein [Paucidesulfovibrio longus]